MKAVFYNFYLQIFISALVICNVLNINAQPLQKAENLLANKNNNQWSFEENRGQLADENGVVLKDIKYYGKDKGVSVYLRKNKISFVFSKTEPKNNFHTAFSEATGNGAFAFSPPFQGGAGGGLDVPEEVKISTSRIDLEIVGANPETQILAEEKISYYTNYYLAHTPEEGITNVPHFKKITYKNIYSNIDLVLYVKEKGMKYEFVVHPKGKVSDIKLSWNGTKPDVLADGGIKYTSALGEITESAPFSFISENMEKVKSGFKVKGNVIGFEVGKYDEKQTLVIDPTLIWGTYYGGSGNNFALGIAINSNNDIYITGGSYSTEGIGTSGAYQSANSGQIDAFIAKFNSKGIRGWGTYYGGNEGDAARGICVDKNNNIYITGNTMSKNGIATQGTHQSNYINPNVVIPRTVTFVAKFNSSGFRVWGTYFGGVDDVNDTFGYKIAIDGNGDVIITGFTSERKGIATVGVHQTVKEGIAGSSGFDAFLAKFSNTGIRIWSTYYGGSNDDAANGVCVDKNNNIYIVGSTNSTIRIATSGTYQATFAGSHDAFIAKFNSSGVRLWGTYYGGSDKDLGLGICMDKEDNILITGMTQSKSGISTPGAHQASFGGGGDAFVAKFNNNGAKIWDTYYGGEGDEYGTDIGTDDFGNIYSTGYTSSELGISTNGTHQIKKGGALDVFIVKFNSVGARQWGTYYGGLNDDKGNAIACFRNNIYVTGTTSSSTNITTKDAHQTSFSNAYIARFGRINDVGAVKINSPIGNTCGGIFDVWVRIKNFNTFFNIDSLYIDWSVNDIIQNINFCKILLKPGDTSSIINIGAANFKGGNNIIKVWTMNPNGGDDIDNSNDTLTRTIYFLPTPDAETGNDTSICIGETVTFGANAKTGHTYSWKSNPQGLISSQSKLTVTPATTTTYFLKETDTTSGCIREDSVTVTVYEYPQPVITGDTAICGKNTAVFQTKNNPGSTYNWQAEGGNIISGQSTSSITVNINKTTKTGKIKLTETNTGCCAANKELTYHYTYSPLSDLRTEDLFICESTSKLIKIDSAGNNNNTYYRWYPDKADTVNFITLKKVKNYYVAVNDICNKEFRAEIKIFSRCPLSLIIFPNPAQRYITIRYSLPETADIKISMYDRLGKEILKIADGKHEAGMYEYKLDATEINLSAAIYAVRMLADKEVLVKQFILLK